MKAERNKRDAGQNYDEKIMQPTEIFLKKFAEQRQKHGLSERTLIDGIMSIGTFGDIKKGKIQISHDAWNLLMHRMGLSTDNFKIFVSHKETEDWKLRESICESVLCRPSEAEKLLSTYRRGRSSQKNIDKQFCLKAEWMISKNSVKAERLLEIGINAVECTVKSDWKDSILKLLLAPEELEAILLVSLSFLKCEKFAEASRLFSQVLEYPKKHNWEEKLQIAILPQIAIVGIMINERIESYSEAINLGSSALEKIKESNSKRYAYFLFKEFISLTQRNDYFDQNEDFSSKMKDYADDSSYSLTNDETENNRVWQIGSIENCYDTSTELKNKRVSLKLTRKEACLDENGNYYMHPRQLMRIEKGESKPSIDNFTFLMRKYNKKEE